MQLLVVLIVGLVAATIPVIVATTREGCTTLAPPIDAPRYLLLTSEPTSRALRCGPVSAEVLLERVASATNGTSRLGDDDVAGIIFDRATLESLPDGIVREWLIAGSGRVLIGMRLTLGEVELYLDSPDGLEGRASSRPEKGKHLSHRA